MSDLLQPDGPTLPEAYFVIERLEDARFSVQLIKRGSTPRKSYAPRVTDVVKQLVRAGLPVQTADDELQRACQERQIELLAAPFCFLALQRTYHTRQLTQAGRGAGACGMTGAV